MEYDYKEFEETIDFGIGDGDMPRELVGSISSDMIKLLTNMLSELS